MHSSLEKSSFRKLKILWIGRDDPVKNIALLFEIANELKEDKFYIVGLDRKENMGNIEFCGRVPHSAIYSYYQNSDLLISTSKTEGLPNVILEAFKYKLPVVSSLYFKDLTDSIFYGGLEKDKLIEQINLIRSNKIEANKKIQKAIAFLNNKYTAEKVYEQFIFGISSMYKN